MPPIPTKKVQYKLCDAPGFTYPGGKYTLRRWIIRWCKIIGTSYVEPFAGRANVFFLMRILNGFKKWHLNDIQTIPFFEAIKRYDGGKLPDLNKEEATELSWRGSDLIYLIGPLITWGGGLCGRSAITGNFDTDVVEYSKTLLQAKELLAGVILTSQDALDVIEEYKDDPNCFIYIDPPYVNASVCAYDTDSVDRVRILNILNRCKCHYLLSEYMCNDALEHLGQPLTVIHSVPVKFSLRSGDNARRVKEYLWANYVQAPLKIDFGDSLSSKPSRESLDIYSRCSGIISYEEWSRVCPEFWSEAQIRSEFWKLGRMPNTYFNGIVVRKL